jgi:hypothetical protein
MLICLTHRLFQSPRASSGHTARQNPSFDCKASSRSGRSGEQMKDSSLEKQRNRREKRGKKVFSQEPMETWRHGSSQTSLNGWRLCVMGLSKIFLILQEGFLIWPVNSRVSLTVTVTVTVTLGGFVLSYVLLTQSRSISVTITFQLRV